MGMAFELQRLGGGHPQQSGAKANCWQRACFDLFVNLLPTDVPVPSQLTDRYVGFGVRFEIL
jgi:hypothetical protein